MAATTSHTPNLALHFTSPHYSIDCLPSLLRATHAHFFSFSSTFSPSGHLLAHALRGLLHDDYTRRGARQARIPFPTRFQACRESRASTTTPLPPLGDELMCRTFLLFLPRTLCRRCRRSMGRSSSQSTSPSRLGMTRTTSRGWSTCRPTTPRLPTSMWYVPLLHLAELTDSGSTSTSGA